jgi:hypothetical protein
LASATIATLSGRRWRNSVTHGPGALAWVSTDLAPWISRVRRLFEEFLAFELQAHDFSRFHVDRVQLKYSFGDINADYVFATIHLGPSGLPVKISFFHFGHFDAVGP